MKGRTKPRIIYNDDTISLRNIPQPHTPEKVHYAVDYLKDTQVDMLCWSMTSNCEAESWLSKAIENQYDRKTYDENSRDLTHGLYQQGIDYLPLLIERAHHNGLQFCTSFRMNDIHHNSTPTVACEFWKSHQQYRLWEVTNGLTYYNACLDYSYPEVRERMFQAMTEVAEAYDIDALEIDFCRSPYVFRPSEGWSKRQILTDYFQQIRTMLKEIGKDKGKNIALIIRVPFRADMLNRAGMDVETWLKDSLPDILVMSNLANDYNQPMEPWLSLCRKHQVLFYPSVEVCPSRRHEDDWRVNATVGRHLGGADTIEWTNAHVHSSRAIAQNYLAQGADGVYMFNYPCALFERSNRLLEKDPLFGPLSGVLREIGSCDTLSGTHKLYYFYTDMPLLVQSNRPPQFHQTVTFFLSDTDIHNPNMVVSLWFRQEARKNPHIGDPCRMDAAADPQWLKYYLNDGEIPPQMVKKSLQPAGSITGFHLREHDLVQITVPSDKLVFGENRLAFHIPHYPTEEDPYIYIYELEVEIFPKHSESI